MNADNHFTMWEIKEVTHTSDIASENVLQAAKDNVELSLGCREEEEKGKGRAKRRTGKDLWRSPVGSALPFLLGLKSKAKERSGSSEGSGPLRWGKTSPSLSAPPPPAAAAMAGAGRQAIIFSFFSTEPFAKGTESICLPLLGNLSFCFCF